MNSKIFLSLGLIAAWAWLGAARVWAGEPVRVYPNPAAVDLGRHVLTESAQTNLLIHDVYTSCVLGRMNQPEPPALPYKWFGPGGPYVGQWVWDTMFVLNAYAPLGDDEGIREVFENYWHAIEHNPEAPKGSYRYGMVPNFVGPTPPLGYSQIPILAWGCEMIYRQMGDRKLIERCLPYLVTFDQWYSTERDVDSDGLIEYGAYKPFQNQDMKQTARYECFDVHPTGDDLVLTEHPKRKGGGKWYGNIDAVDQTCFVIMGERSIAALARLVGQNELAARYEKIIKRRVKALRKKCWDPKTQFFYSLKRDSDEKIPVRTIQAFLTLCCDAATKEQAAALVKHLTDPKEFWPEYPVPTVALDDAKFDPVGFWRGDIWPVTNYLVGYGLNRYGYYSEARELTRRVLNHTGKFGINERYNGRTGEPLGVPGLGMSCAVWSLVVQNEYGVDEDFRTIRVPESAAGKWLRLGKLEVGYPAANSVRLRSGFDRTFQIIFPENAGNVKTKEPQQDKARYEVTCDGKPLEPGKIKVAENEVTFSAQAGKEYIVTRRHCLSIDR